MMKIYEIIEMAKSRRVTAFVDNDNIIFYKYDNCDDPVKIDEIHPSSLLCELLDYLEFDVEVA